jgi:hypothetical protein
MSAEPLHNEVTASWNVTLEQQSSQPFVEAFGFEALWAKPNIEGVTVHFVARTSTAKLRSAADNTAFDYNVCTKQQCPTLC